MKSDERIHVHGNINHLPVDAEPVDQLNAVKMTEMKEVGNHRDLSKLSKQSPSYFMVPQEDDDDKDTFRGKCAHMIHSYKFQAVVVGFVLLDCIFVISELIVDLRVTKSEVCDKVTCEPIKKDHSLSVVFQSLSLAILSIFMIELVFKLWVLRLKFFQSKMEIFDAIIVIVSWSLDITFFHHGDDAEAISLLIFLRMWRLIRIVHAIAVSMITPVAHQLEQEEQAHAVTEGKLYNLKDYTKELEDEISELRAMLVESDRCLPETKVRERHVKIRSYGSLLCLPNER